MLSFVHKDMGTIETGCGLGQGPCILCLSSKVCTLLLKTNTHHDGCVGNHIAALRLYGHTAYCLIQPSILFCVFPTAFVNTGAIIDHSERSYRPPVFVGSLFSGFWHTLNLMLSLVIWINSKPDKMSSTCKTIAIKGIWKINSLFMSMPQTWVVLICHLSLHLSVNSRLNWLLMILKWIILEESII